ncbi:MAG TPA: AAA family ATPase, partial [Erysipelotrichaceae bacterium]|nr:AAA family ATPase [Erysipelotrichaceae bacterium]
MYIKSYKTRRFAGIKDIEVNFLKGLNVILGPNEAGKSSIIEGMHATLFQDVKLRKSTNRDRNFIYKYMPKPDGDFIDGQLTINNLKGDYSIFKEWGSSELVELVNADNNLVKDEVRVKEILSKLLLFNEGTYSNIIFAKQRHIKEALEKIIQDDGVTQEVNDILRKTLMDLDGVSLDAIESNLNIAVDDLYKRWDIEKNYPINNRGISNPYVNNRGAILDSYYNKEELKIKMDETKKLEKAFDVANQKLQEVNTEIEALKLEKVDLESIEEDVNQRALLEVSIAPIKKDVEELFAINRQWPLTVENIKNLSQKEVSLKEKGEELIKEKSNVAKVERKIFLNEKLKTVESILKNIKEKQNKLKDIPQI